MEEIWDNFSENAIGLLSTDFNWQFYKDYIAKEIFEWSEFAFPTEKEITKIDAELMLKCNMFGYVQNCYYLLSMNSDFFKGCENINKLKESLELFKALEPAQELLDKINNHFYGG